MTVRELKEVLEKYSDDLAILIRTDSGYHAFDVIADVGILDYLGEEPIYGDDISDFVYAAIAQHGKDPYKDASVSYVLEVYEEELTPKLILE